MSGVVLFPKETIGKNAKQSKQQNAIEIEVIIARILLFLQKELR